MGSKNRIFLGILTALMLHNVRKTFQKKELYITKRKAQKIAQDHPEVKVYLGSDFKVILESTVAECAYHEDGVLNFLSRVEGRYILYSISSNNFHTEISTMFYCNKRRLKRCHETANFFHEDLEKEFLEFIEN